MNISNRLWWAAVSTVSLVACSPAPDAEQSEALSAPQPRGALSARFTRSLHGVPAALDGRGVAPHAPLRTVGYTIVDLGTDEVDSFAVGLNEAGEVVGHDAGPGSSRAWSWSGGVRTILPTFGGAFSAAASVNDAGDIVGDSSFPGEVVTHAFLYAQGTLTDLGTLGGPFSAASAINDAGQIVGDSLTTSDPGSRRAFLWQNGTMRDLGTLGGTTSTAAAITQTGYITGDARTEGGDRHAYLSDGERMFDLGTLGGPESFGTSKNAAGLIVGESSTASHVSHAFAWQDGVMRDLGTLGGARSAALGVNEDGLIVGRSDVPVGSAVHATRWRRGHIDDLNVLVDAPDWTLIEADAVNTRGQIVGFGQHGAHLHAFLLNPVEPPDAP